MLWIATKTGVLLFLEWDCNTTFDGTRGWSVSFWEALWQRPYHPLLGSSFVFRYSTLESPNWCHEKWILTSYYSVKYNPEKVLRMPSFLIGNCNYYGSSFWKMLYFFALTMNENVRMDIDKILLKDGNAPLRNLFSLVHFSKSKRQQYACKFPAIFPLNHILGKLHRSKG